RGSRHPYYVIRLLYYGLKDPPCRFDILKSSKTNTATSANGSTSFPGRSIKIITNLYIAVR
ncbi:MAG: hypothetical protein ACI30S_01260, partial [Muribaculaceae bacterium]